MSIIPAKDKELHQKHRERMRTRFLKSGGKLDAFAEHEILEMLLYNFIPFKDTNELAHQLLSHFGSIKGVFGASRKSLMEFNLIGETVATNMKIFNEALRHIKASQKWDKRKLNTSAALRNFAKSILEDATTEEVLMIALDANFMLLDHTKCNSTSAVKATVDTRKLISLISHTNAVYVAFAHVHPQSDSTPSDADDKFTSEMLEALAKFDIMVVEHLILGSMGDFYSYFSTGRIYKLLTNYFHPDKLKQLVSLENTYKQ